MLGFGIQSTYLIFDIIFLLLIYSSFLQSYIYNFYFLLHTKQLTAKCSQKYHNQALNTKYLMLKKWATNVTQKLTHKRYSKSDPQRLSKRWSTNVTLKVIHKRYSKSDPQTLLKKWSTKDTQIVIHKHYSKTDTQTVLKKWFKNVLYLIHKRSCTIVNFFLQICVFVHLSVFYQLFKLVFYFGFVFLIFKVVSLALKLCI